jgi:hypothetical protein
VFAHACRMGLEGIVSKRKLRPLAGLDQEQEPGLRCGEAGSGGGPGGGSRGRITLGEHQRRRAEPRWPCSSTLGPTIHRCQFYCDASSKPGNTTISAPLELGPRNAQAKPRQFEPPDGHGLRLRWVSRRDCRWHSFRSRLRAQGAGGVRRRGRSRRLDERGKGVEPPGRAVTPGALLLDRHKEDHPEGGRR